MKKVDLNVDIGEGFPYDRELLEFATSANVCCGVHAGSWELTAETIELCLKKKVRVGAHPGYPDREGFGRAPMPQAKQKEYLDSLFQQVQRFCRHTMTSYIKPHGAFYNETAVVLPVGWDQQPPDEEPMSPYSAGGRFLSAFPGVNSLGMLLRVHRVSLMGLPLTAHEIIAQRAGKPFIREGFADRAYEESGTLVPRDQPGAVLTDPAAIKAQVLKLAPHVDSICLHGDTPKCLEFAELVHRSLVDAGYRVGH
jgi:5-oxoprolinase (ATP-hydrolysing) subunit A